MAEKIRISEKEIEILAHRLLPVIRQYFEDDKVKQEFREWLSVKGKNNEPTDEDKIHKL